LVQWTNFFHLIVHKIFVLSLSYLRMLSDKLSSKTALYTNFGQKTCTKRPGAAVIDMQNMRLRFFYIRIELTYTYKLLICKLKNSTIFLLLYRILFLVDKKCAIFCTNAWTRWRIAIPLPKMDIAILLKLYTQCVLAFGVFPEEIHA
jgi:hypothetical protein